MSGSNRIEVEFGARTSELAAKTQEAAGKVNAFGQSVAAASSSAGSAWSSLARVFEERGGVMGKTIAAVTVGITGLGVAVAGISLSKLITDAVDSGGALHDMAQKTGMSVEALSALKSIGKTSETSLESIAAAANKMSVNMASASEEGKGAAAALRALGIDFSAFQALSPEQRMLTVAKAMAEFKDGAGKTAAAIGLMGRQGAEMLPFLADLAETGELQAKVTAEQAAQADTFGDNMVKLKANTEGWKKELAYGILPALTQFSTVLVDVIGGAGGLRAELKKLADDGTFANWVRAAIDLSTYVIDDLQIIARLGEQVSDMFGTIGAKITAFFGGQMAAVMAAMTGHFSSAQRIFQSSMEKVEEIESGYRKRYEERWGKPLIGAQIREGMKNYVPPAATGDDKKDVPYVNAKGGGNGGSTEAPKSQMPAFEEQLAQARAAATELDAIHGMTKAQELAFWQQIMAKEQLVAADRIAVAKKVAEGRVAMLREEAKTSEQLDKVRLESSRDRMLAEVDQQEESAKQMLAAGEITQKQLLALEQQFENERFAIKQAALQKAAEVLDPQQDPVQVQQIHAQLEQLEQQHQQRMAQIRTQLVTQQVQEQSRLWDSLSSTVAGLWDRGIQAMMNGTLTWRGAFKAIGTEMTRWFANAVIGEQVKAWLRGQMVKLSSAVTGAAAERTAVAAGSAATVATKATEATAVVGANAAEAASGAAASQASIPWVGPVLAAAAFAATMAMVLGARSSIKSAEGGYDIPAGVNPLTQLHQNEMVLPAEHANTIRRLGRMGMGGDGTADFGGEPAPVYNITVQHNISALDGADVKRVLMRNSEAVAASIHKAVRDFALTPETLKRGR